MALFIRPMLSKHTYILIFCVLIIPTASRPLNFIQWIENAIPHKGQTLQDELKCYALPFGGIGFASHLLTYYTIIMLSAGRSPWLWKKNRHWRFDLFLSIVGLVWTVGATILTMIRCRQRWEFVVMAFWKMMMSLTLSTIATHAAVIVRRKIALGHFSKNPGSNPSRSKIDHVSPSDHSTGTETLSLISLQAPTDVPNMGDSEVEGEGPANATGELLETSPRQIPSAQVWGWVVFYAIGIVVGYSGLFSLVRQSWHIHAVRNLTIAYISIMVAFVLVGILIGLQKKTKDEPGILFMGIFFLLGGTGMIAALYGDWILAAIDNNYTGFPDGNNEVLYWTYFAAKRLPIASF